MKTPVDHATGIVATAETEKYAAPKAATESTAVLNMENVGPETKTRQEAHTTKTIVENTTKRAVMVIAVALRESGGMNISRRQLRASVSRNGVFGPIFESLRVALVPTSKSTTHIFISLLGLMSPMKSLLPSCNQRVTRLQRYAKKRSIRPAPVGTVRTMSVPDPQNHLHRARRLSGDRKWLSAAASSRSTFS